MALTRHVRRMPAVVAALLLWITPAAAQDKPNIVLIMTDDLGYGDLSAYGATALPTPNIDRLAKQGLRFTDAHSSAATCTPSRYALLTGEYAWRKPGTGVLPGNAALIIEPNRTTLPSVLKRVGYTTAVVGKWHLGLGPQGGPDWNGDVTPGPNDVGFDYAFIMAATGDRVPTIYIENRRAVGGDPADPIAVSYGTPLVPVVVTLLATGWLGFHAHWFFYDSWLVALLLAAVAAGGVLVLLYEAFDERVVFRKKRRPW